MKTTYCLTALLASAAMLTACGGEREAEAEIGGATAEVTTDKPESQVSDQQLQNAAEGAAAAAATPQASASVVVTAPSTGEPGGPPASGGAAPTAGAAGVAPADAAR